MDPKVVEVNQATRLRAVQRATTTYLSRYNELITVSLNHVIYDSFLPENLRITITRWRLSCHNLKIETGRREPYIVRHLRHCLNCGDLEDESHALFSCPLYASSRRKYATFLARHAAVAAILNPPTVEDAIVVGNYLTEIESVREELGY